MTVDGVGRRLLTVEASCPSQNKDLKSRLASSEGFQKPSSSLSQLEAQNRELQERLQAEERCMSPSSLSRSGLFSSGAPATVPFRSSQPSLSCLFGELFS